MIVIDWNLARSLGKTYGVWKCNKTKMDFQNMIIVALWNCSNFLYKWQRNNHLRMEFYDWVLYLHITCTCTYLKVHNIYMYKAHGPSRRVFIFHFTVGTIYYSAWVDSLLTNFCKAFNFRLIQKIYLHGICQYKHYMYVHVFYNLSHSLTVNSSFIIVIDFNCYTVHVCVHTISRSNTLYTCTCMYSEVSDLIT